MSPFYSPAFTFRFSFLGTILSAFAVLLGCKTEYGEKWQTAFFLNLLAGSLQFLTAIIVVGWVWSVMTGEFDHSNPLVLIWLQMILIGLSLPGVSMIKSKYINRNLNTDYECCLLIDCLIRQCPIENTLSTFDSNALSLFLLQMRPKNGTKNC